MHTLEESLKYLNLALQVLRGAKTYKEKYTIGLRLHRIFINCDDESLSNIILHTITLMRYSENNHETYRAFHSTPLKSTYKYEVLRRTSPKTLEEYEKSKYRSKLFIQYFSIYNPKGY